MTYPETAVRSAELYEKAQMYMPGGNTRTTVYMSPFPIYAKKGKGCRVWDVDGVERIDVINNFTSLIHGHAHPYITATVSKQLADGTCFGAPTESEIDLAERLVKRVASVEQVRFMNSGTEAVMMALKAARAFTGRTKIIKVEGAYHGSYDFAEVSLDSSPSNWGVASPSSIAYAKGTPKGITDDVIVIPFNDTAAALKMIRMHADELAAVLIDPLPNRVGLIPATQEYLQAIRALLSEVGALLIMDEVISFRLAYEGAQSLWGCDADLTVFGKLIGGGFPVGAVGGSRKVMSVFDPTNGKPKLPHGGTFSANPISMVAGCASVDLLTRETYQRLNEMGDYLRDSVQGSFLRHQLVGSVTGIGSLLKIHFVDGLLTDYRSVYPDKIARLQQSVFARELINQKILPSSYGLVALSTAITNDDLEQIAASIDGALKAVKYQTV